MKRDLCPEMHNQSGGKGVFAPCIKLIKIIKDSVENIYQNQVAIMEDNRGYTAYIKYGIQDLCPKNSMIFQTDCTLLKACAKPIDGEKTIPYTTIVKPITILQYTRRTTK